MANEEFMDFDQFLTEEVKATPHKYKLFGREGTIPASIPYGIVLEYQTLAQMGEDAEVSSATVHKMLEFIFGKERVAEWVNTPDFDAETMGAVLRWAMKKYNLAGDTEAPKEKPARGKAKIVQLRSET